MKSVLSLILLQLVYSCNSSNNNTSDKNQSTYNSKFDILYMQQKIDSAATLYSMAITKAKNGILKDEIIRDYEPNIKRLHKEMSLRFDSITNLMEAKKISPQEYELIKTSMNFTNIKKESKELMDLGIQIRLK
jgi:hypothetical protein